MNKNTKRSRIKFRNFTFWKGFDNLFIFPEIVITIDEPIYREKNFRIAFHWLGWHLGWFFIKEI